MVTVNIDKAVSVADRESACQRGRLRPAQAACGAPAGRADLDCSTTVHPRHLLLCAWLSRRRGGVRV